MLSILRALREASAVMNIPILQIIGLIKTLFEVGLPPSVSDEAALRAWIAKLTDAIQEFALLSPTDFDDKIALFLENTLANDKAWSVFYSILSSFFPADDGIMKAVALETQMLGASELATLVDPEQKLGLDPMTIMAIIQAVVSIINMWRNRKV